MKKIVCLFVVFLISNAANAADKWEYVQFAKDGLSPFLVLTYPDGKMESWSMRQTNPPKGFSLFGDTRTRTPMAIVLKRDFGKPINVINALGFLGFEMCGLVHIPNDGTGDTTYWFKRKIK